MDYFSACALCNDLLTHYVGAACGAYSITPRIPTPVFEAGARRLWPPC
jgi:hypothetical protein